MKRTLIRLGLPLLLLGLFVGWCLWPREKVVPAVAMLLKEGMTLEQVDVLLGLG